MGLSLRDLSVRRKLPLIVTATSGAALLLASAAFLGYHQLVSRRAATRSLEMLCDILAAQIAPAVAFDDAKSGGEVLAPLRQDPQIQGAAVYRMDGSALAAFRRENVTLTKPERFGTFELDDGYLIVRPVLQEARTIGTLTLRADLQLLRQQFLRGLGLALLVWAAASAAALALSLKLGGMITRPILHLAGIVREVTARENFDLRAQPHGKDEPGQLIDGFNDMLVRLHGRDVALRGATAELERKLKELGEARDQLDAQQNELATYHDLVTHDVTNFAGTLMVIMEHLLDRPDGSLDAKTLDLLRRANRQVFQLNRLANNAKALHRVRRKGLPPATGKAVLGELLRRVVDTVRSVHFDRPFDAEINCHPGVTLREIPFLENVLLNLVDNAVKHTPKDEKPRIVATATSEAGRVRLKVRGGAPSDTELRNRLFERYSRGPHSTGAGLGLTVVREIVERAGGSVTVANARNEDATESFEVTLDLPEA
ncbi:MAG TPA: ATP-binding protein [Planctomycetota bacterium]